MSNWLIRYRYEDGSKNETAATSRSELKNMIAQLLDEIDVMTINIRRIS